MKEHIKKKFILKSIVILFVSVIALAYNRNFLKLGKNIENAITLQPEFDKDGYWRTQNFIVKKNDDDTFSYYGTKSLYGAYLAGRVAHLRQDFENAAEYYKIVIDKDASNKTVNRTIYVILSYFIGCT